MGQWQLQLQWWHWGRSNRSKRTVLQWSYCDRVVVSCIAAQNVDNSGWWNHAKCVDGQYSRRFVLQ
jgi:hypothetical protein